MQIPRENLIRRSLAVSAVALAVALAGCGDGTPVEEIGAGGAASSSRASTVVPPAGPADGSRATTSSGPGPGGGSEPSEPPDASPGEPGHGEPGQTEPSPPTSGVTPPPAGEAHPPGTRASGAKLPHQWEGFTVGGDGRTITFTYYAGVEPCSAFDSIVADEGADSVRVTIYEHSGPEGVACIMLAQQKSASVTLASPLGGRTLIDGAAG